MSEQNDYKFPFIGAGRASYFEWAEVQVVFQNTPNKEQKKKISKSVPFPINDINWEENMLSAGSGQFAHVDIATTYQTKDGLDPEDKKDWDDDWFFAADSQVAAFNQDIERWLNEIHQISPVLLAFRREDSESDGTEFSDWHKWSMKNVDSILPYFDTFVENFDDDSYKSEVLRNILYMKEEVAKLDKKHVKYLYPGDKEVKAFLKKGDIEPLKNSSKNKVTYVHKMFELLVEELDTEQAKHRDNVIKHADSLFGFEKSISKEVFEKLCANIWLSAYEEKVQDLMDKVPKSNVLGDTIAYKAWKFASEGKFDLSIPLFDSALITGGNDLSLYGNALYVLQNDNTGMPINIELNNSFLEICLPYAPKYPAIFFNACCLYVEMEMYNEAYKMVQKAIEYKYNDIKSVQNQIKSLSMFKEFRTKTDALKLFTKN